MRGAHIVPKVHMLPSGIKWLMLEALGARCSVVRDTTARLQRRIWETVLRLMRGSRR